MIRPTHVQLRATPYFLGCTTGELAELMAVTEVVGIEPGVVVAEGGAPAGDVHLVLAGRAVSTPPGQRWGPGDFIGELAALQRGRQHVTVVAATAMTLLCARGPDAERFLAHPAVAVCLSRALGRRLSAT